MLNELQQVCKSLIICFSVKAVEELDTLRMILNVEKLPAILFFEIAMCLFIIITTFVLDDK
jgi:hypothetical protein